MTLTYVEPPEGLALRAHDWAPVATSRETTSAIDGGQQVVATPSERWTATLALRVAGRALLDEWRGFRADMRGRLRYTRFRPRSVASEAAAETGRAFWSDGAGFSDGARWSAAYALAAGAGLFARRLTIDGPDLSAWRRGLIFGLGEATYIVTGVEARTATQVVVRIAPGLRAAAAAGAGVDCAPTVAVRFETDREGEGAFGVERFGDAQLRLIEVFP